MTGIADLVIPATAAIPAITSRSLRTFIPEPVILIMARSRRANAIVAIPKMLNPPTKILKIALRRTNAALANLFT